jgi:zinc transport system substrate-binding protein
MKKAILLIALLSLPLMANLNVVASIVPQVTFINAIGGKHVNTTLMVEAGNSPHTYEPKPSQMRQIAHADLYFAIGVEFEKVWLPKFQNQNSSMVTIDTSKGIVKRVMKKEAHHHHGEEHDEEKKIKKDPHVWVSPENVKIIANNIYQALIKHDPKHKADYTTNYNNFVNLINETDKKIQTILSNYHDKKFMVFHPSWGYFAKQYHLQQIPIEVEGKKLKPKELIELIKHAKEKKIDVIIAQKEFSTKEAQIVANEIGINLQHISPLNPKWSQNLIRLAHIIAHE